MPGLDVRRAEPGLLAEAGALVDTVFNGSRGGLPLSARFPHVLSMDNAANVFVGLVAGRVVSTVATRPFAWARGSRSGRAAMIGLVATDPGHRGQGIATAVLREAVAGLAEGGAFSVVLWTIRPAIYERLGFVADDPGVLGVVSGGFEGETLPAPEPVEPEGLEALRLDSESLQLDRSAAAWAVIPPPAEEVVVYRTERAYALAGRAGAASYVYELVGDDRDFGLLLGGLRRNAETVYVNDAPASRSYRALGAIGVAWQPKALGMWLRLGPDAGSGLYVPYFDRI